MKNLLVSAPFIDPKHLEATDLWKYVQFWLNLRKYRRSLKISSFGSSRRLCLVKRLAYLVFFSRQNLSVAGSTYISYAQASQIVVFSMSFCCIYIRASLWQLWLMLQLEPRLHHIRPDLILAIKIMVLRQRRLLITHCSPYMGRSFPSPIASCATSHTFHISVANSLNT